MPGCGVLRPIGIVGFSNGGFLASRLVQYCRLPEGVRWVVAVGSSGSWRSADPSDLTRCGRLRLLLGSDDAHLPHARKYAEHLLRLGADVRLNEHPGGHTLLFEPLHASVKTLLGFETR